MVSYPVPSQPPLVNPWHSDNCVDDIGLMHCICTENVRRSLATNLHNDGITWLRDLWPVDSEYILEMLSPSLVLDPGIIAVRVQAELFYRAAPHPRYMSEQNTNRLSSLYLLCPVQR